MALDKISKIKHVFGRNVQTTNPYKAEFFPSDPNLVLRIIKYCREDKLIPEPPAKVIDLGCGDGMPAAMFAYHGYKTYGIDIQPELIELAQDSARQFPQLDMRFACGNYLPTNIRQQAKKATHLITDDTPDPYEKLGITLEDIDIFFAYPFPSQIETIMQTFEQHGKKGTSLLAIGDEEMWNYKALPPKNITHLCVSVTAYNRFTLYTKTS